MAMLELRMAIKPGPILKAPRRIALSTLDRVPVAITTSAHACTSLYQQLPASRSGLYSNKKRVEAQQFHCYRARSNSFAPGIITPWPHTALYAYVNCFKYVEELASPKK
jgi:hypothetical protein